MPAPMTQGAYGSALVVDDDEFSFENLRLKLQRLNITTIGWAPNGRAAMAILDAMAAPPDLVICDIFMPEMDGIEFSEHLRQRKYQGGLILISGGGPTMLEIAQFFAVEIRLNVLGAFNKPVSVQSLEGALTPRIQ